MTELSHNPTSEHIIKHKDLIFQKKIGQGAFGVVWKAEYNRTPVAVKKLLFGQDGTLTEDQINDFVSEALTMK